MSYPLLKSIHVSMVVLTALLFALRGVLVMVSNRRLESRFLRVVPHVVDFALLASAIALSVMIQQYPLTHPWLTAKMAGLLAYIGLGLVVMRFAARRSQRFLAFVGALAAFGYVVSVALTKQYWPFA